MCHTYVLNSLLKPQNKSKINNKTKKTTIKPVVFVLKRLLLSNWNSHSFLESKTKIRRLTNTMRLTRLRSQRTKQNCMVVPSVCSKLEILFGFNDTRQRKTLVIIIRNFIVLKVTEKPHSGVCFYSHTRQTYGQIDSSGPACWLHLYYTTHGSWCIVCCYYILCVFLSFAYTAGLHKHFRNTLLGMTVNRIGDIQQWQLANLILDSISLA